LWVPDQDPDKGPLLPFEAGAVIVTETGSNRRTRRRPSTIASVCVSLGSRAASSQFSRHVNSARYRHLLARERELPGLDALPVEAG
jgi:hypothetical protein